MNTRSPIALFALFLLMSVAIVVGQVSTGAEQQTEPCEKHKNNVDANNLDPNVNALFQSKDPSACGYFKLNQDAQCDAKKAKEDCAKNCKTDQKVNCREHHDALWNACVDKCPADNPQTCYENCRSQAQSRCEKLCDEICQNSLSGDKRDGYQFPGYSKNEYDQNCGKQCETKIKETTKQDDWQFQAVKDQKIGPTECQGCVRDIGNKPDFSAAHCAQLIQKCGEAFKQVTGTLNACEKDALAKNLRDRLGDAGRTPSGLPGVGGEPAPQGISRQLTAEEQKYAQLNSRKLEAEVANLEQQTGMAREQFEFQKENAAAQLALQEKQISTGLLSSILSPTISGLFGLAQTAMQQQSGPEAGNPSSPPSQPERSPIQPSQICTGKRPDGTTYSYSTTGSCPLANTQSVYAGQSDIQPIPFTSTIAEAEGSGTQDVATTDDASTTPTTAAVVERTTRIGGDQRGGITITGSQTVSLPRSTPRHQPTPANPTDDFHNREKTIRQQFRHQSATLLLQRAQAGTPTTGIAFLTPSLLQETTTGAQQELAALYRDIDTVTVTDRINILHGNGATRPNAYTLEGGDNTGVTDADGIIQLSPGGRTRIAVSNPSGAIITDPDRNTVILMPGTATYVGTGGPQSGWETRTNLNHPDSGVLINPVDTDALVTFNKGFAALAPNAIDLRRLGTDRWELQTRGSSDIILAGLNAAIPFASRGALKGNSHIIYYKDALPANDYDLIDAAGYRYTLKREDLNGRLRTADGHLIFSTSNPPVFLSAAETALLYNRPAKDLPFVLA